MMSEQGPCRDTTYLVLERADIPAAEKARAWHDACWRHGWGPIDAFGAAPPAPDKTRSDRAATDPLLRRRKFRSCQFVGVEGERCGKWLGKDKARPITAKPLCPEHGGWEASRW